MAIPQSAFRLPDGYDYDGAIAATVTSTGRTLKLDFAQPLATPPADLTDHLEAVIGGAKWPLGAAELDPADPRTLLIPLTQPVVGNKTGTAPGTADIRYDGDAGLSSADGNVINGFWSTGPNHSTYELRTRWADQVGPRNALPEYPRPQLTRTDWRNLNGSWQFAAATAGERPRSARTSPNASSSRTRWSPSSRASNAMRTACGTAAPSPSPPTGRSARASA